MSKGRTLQPVDQVATSRPDMFDVVSVLFEAARGRPPAAQLTLLDAAQVLIDHARAGLVEAPPVAPARRAGTGARRAKAVTRRRSAPEPAAPRAAAAGMKDARPTAPVRAAAPAAERGGADEEAEVFDHNGVTVTIGPGSASVEHAERVIEVGVKQARLVACTARTMPVPVDRKFIARAVWAGERVPESADNIITTVASQLAERLAGIGLTLKTVRGVGIALQREGE